ncbi:MAG: ATP-binding cassette domain-containing protein [Christensenellaceae bacterium]|nr:ATP-binding cassette domain-containing protein [Christensenellaceae bacterium]
MFINRKLLSFIKSNCLGVALSCLMQVIITLLGTLIALGSALCVCFIQGQEKILFFTSLWQVLLCIALLLFVRHVLSQKKAIIAEKSSIALKTRLRELLLKKLFTLGPAHTLAKRTGDTASILYTRVLLLKNYYTAYLPSAVSAICNAVIILLVLAVFNKLTAALCAFACLGIFVCPMLFYRIMHKRGEKEMALHGKYYSDCLDSLQGMNTLKGFNASKRQIKKIAQSGEELRKAIMAQLQITMLENVVSHFFIALGTSFAVAVAAQQTYAGNMLPEQLPYALFLISACFAPMATLLNAWHLGYQGVTASTSIAQLLDEPVHFALPLEPAKPIDKQTSTDRNDICFINVSFAYEVEEGVVLKDISFEIPEGTSLALVGPSGAGKSTAAHLLAGFYPIKQGSISVGDVPISENSLPSIQGRIAAVWQDSHLFYGTIEENIRMGRQNASIEDIQQAAIKAGIHGFINALPDGYKTMVGERGMRLSGGERQRLVMARAFLRDTPILILDEATSSLDRENEELIQRSLLKLRQGKTVLMIAHRLATIQSADKIILLDEGRIAAQGTHEELLASSPLYNKLMGSQLIGEYNETKQ